MTGGRREGAGRKPAPPHLKKEPVGMKLPRWLLDWTAAQPESRAELIERALIETYKLTPPSGEDA